VPLAGGAFTGPAPGGQAGLLCEVRGNDWVVAVPRTPMRSWPCLVGLRCRFRHPGRL